MKITQISIGGYSAEDEWEKKVSEIPYKNGKRKTLDVGSKRFESKFRLSTFEDHNNLLVKDGEDTPMENISIIRYTLEYGVGVDKTALKTVNSSRVYTPILLPTDQFAEEMLVSVTIDSTRYQMISYRTYGPWIRQSNHISSDDPDIYNTHVGCVMSIPLSDVIQEEYVQLMRLDVVETETGKFRVFDIVCHPNEMIGVVEKPITTAMMSTLLGYKEQRLSKKGSSSFRCQSEKITTDLIFIEEGTEPEVEISPTVQRPITVIGIPGELIKSRDVNAIMDYIGGLENDGLSSIRKKNIRACTVVDFDLPLEVIRQLRFVFVFRYNTETKRCICKKSP